MNIGSTMDPQYWCEGHAEDFKVRGPTYLEDHVKMTSGPNMFHLVGCDLFELDRPADHICAHPDNVVYKMNKAWMENGSKESERPPFIFCVNIILPGPPFLSAVHYMTPKDPSMLTDGSPFAELMGDFMDMESGNNEFRDSRFKIIPGVRSGGWFVERSVGSTPAIMGKKLRVPYHRGVNHFELGIDVASSSVANAVVGMVGGMTKKLVVDIAFLLESQTAEELPEQIISVVRWQHLDLECAVKLTVPDHM